MATYYSATDKSYMDQDPAFKKAIEDAKKAYASAGTQAEKDAAHAAAEAARSKYNYSGGAAGNSVVANSGSMSAEEADKALARQIRDGQITGDDVYKAIKQLGQAPGALTVGTTGAGTASYTGMSSDEYRNKLLDIARSGINSSADTQLATIQKNLDTAMADLATEKSKARPLYDNQIKDIGDQQFATEETRREQMAQSGWLPNNSGLQQGEMTKIAVGADKERSDAAENLVATLNDIARRITLANTQAGNDRTAVENQRATQLSGAEAQALVDAENRNYNMYRDNKSDFYNDRNYNTEVAQDARNFDYQKSRDQSADEKWLNEFNQNNAVDKRNYDYQVKKDNRDYNYQVTRDKVLDSEWMKNFNYQQKQDMINQALQNRQISVSEANNALSSARLEWEKSEDNPDNKLKKEELLTSQDARESGNTIGPLYNDMMNSGDPAKWLIDNSAYLKNDELKELYSKIPKTGNTVDTQALLDLINGK